MPLALDCRVQWTGQNLQEMEGLCLCAIGLPCSRSIILVAYSNGRFRMLWLCYEGHVKEQLSFAASTNRLLDDNEAGL